jgi:hypothetical protein
MQRVTEFQDTDSGVILSFDNDSQIRIRKPLKILGNVVNSPSHRLTFAKLDDNNMKMTILDKRTQKEDDAAIGNLEWARIISRGETSPKLESFASGKDWKTVAKRIAETPSETPQAIPMLGSVPYTDDPFEYSGGRKRRRTNRSLSKSSRRRQSRRLRKSRGRVASL